MKQFIISTALIFSFYSSHAQHLDIQGIPTSTDTVAKITVNYQGSSHVVGLASFSEPNPGLEFGIGAYFFGGHRGIRAESLQGRGLEGISVSDTGVSGSSDTGIGVTGQSASNFGVSGVSNTGIAIRGESSSFYGIYGISTPSTGVRGLSNSGFGVHGLSTGNVGVRGQSTSGFGMHGTSTSNFGIYGVSSTDTGVFGNSDTGIGIQGQSATHFGVYGLSTTSTGTRGQSTSGTGVDGISANSIGTAGQSNSSIGVRGTSNSGIGVWGASNTGYGVYANSDSTFSVYSSSDNATGAYIHGGGGIALELGGANSSFGQGTDDAVIRTQEDQTGGDLFLVTNDVLQVHLDEDDNSVGESLKVFNGTNTEIFDLDVNGNLTIPGTLTDGSDQFRKDHILEVSPDLILEKLSTLSISEWSYRNEKYRHIGPMAQDFHRAFGLGKDDSGIATVDADGIAMAAIQGLYSKNEVLESLIVSQQSEINTLKKELEVINDLLRSFANGNPTNIKE